MKTERIRHAPFTSSRLTALTLKLPLAFLRPSQWLRILLVVAVLALLLGAVSRDGGARSLWSVAERGAACLPALFALEGLRLMCEALSSRALVRKLGQSAPARSIWHATVTCHTLATFAPAGRLVAEVTKGAMLARWLPSSSASALAITTQVLSLLATALLCTAGAAFVLLDHLPRLLLLALALQTIATGGLGCIIWGVLRKPAFRRWVLRRLPRVASKIVPAEGDISALADFPWCPLAWHLANRALLMMEFTLAATSVGIAISPSLGLLAGSLQLAAATVTDFVPAQLGGAEGAFVWFRAQLHADSGQALAMACLPRCAQWLWAGVGAVASFYWRSGHPEMSPGDGLRAITGTDLRCRSLSSDA